MEFLILWLILGVVVGLIANSKGRSGFGWFLYGFLIWPVALVHILVAKPETKIVEARQVAAGDARKCPHCAEIIKAEAKVCRFCGREVA